MHLGLTTLGFTLVLLVPLLGSSQPVFHEKKYFLVAQTTEELLEEEDLSEEEISESVESAEAEAGNSADEAAPAPEESDEIVEETVGPEETEPVEESSVANEPVPSESETETTIVGDDEILYRDPYMVRRTSWGTLLSFGYSQYNPEDYEPDFVLDQAFSDYYGSPETPLLDLTISVKKNFSWSAISLDISVGYYKNDGKNQSSLTLIPARLGMTLALDTFFDEPYVVPYAGGGAYTMIYREEQGPQAVNGNTEISFYYNAGLRFQLDWLDSDGDFASYEEQGVENTFLFLEARSFMLPATSFPDLSSPEDQPIQFGAGLSLEF